MSRITPSGFLMPTRESVILIMGVAKTECGCTMSSFQSLECKFALPTFNLRYQSGP